MENKEFFVSYNKENKDWAKWVAGTLEEYGYTVYLQAWDILPGDDFIDRMNTFLKHTKCYIAIWSKAFLQSSYCKRELQTAFNEHLNKNIRLFLPIRVEDIPLDPLYQTTVYIDLFNCGEDQAEKKLLNAIGYTKNPRKKGRFPTRLVSLSSLERPSENSKPSFPISLPSSISNVKSTTPRIRNIIIFENSRKKKGDLFNLLVSDVFHALGFGQPIFNVSKTGREIDMIIPHRTEKRIALVESKVQNEKIGSPDINKFVGVLDVERANYMGNGTTTVGYFISKSGFTASAIEQEQERNKARNGVVTNTEIILLGPNEIARELIQGNVLCSLEQAASAVSIPASSTLFLCESADLLVSMHGWIWVLYYSEYPRQKATHFAFVHADGNQLLNDIATCLLQNSQLTQRHFLDLTYLDSPLHHKHDKSLAQDAYFNYLKTELGDLQFEGMPADKDSGSIKVNLESIFVPLLFTKLTDDNHQKNERQSVTIDAVLRDTNRAAILAKPGGGKSTLIRRVALAYAFPERRKMVDDKLPSHNWFPVYIRCRDLGNDAGKSISQIIQSIVYRAEISQYEQDFKSLIEDAMQTGRVLLLIDGLDEISSEQYRLCFVNQLRTFVATYPQVHLLITSREAGFRSVAGILTSYCKQYSIAALEPQQIEALSIKWHQAIMDNATQAQLESENVCNIILKDPRIIALAENPLLLTTLLFVKRWVGYLPTKKCQLYSEMIKLLLVTWNAAAHIRLELDETEPQLAFVAYYMTEHGQQKITRDKLEKCISDARKAMPDLLSYTAINPSKFIDQVEERSSLLIQQGFEENERGKLVPSYEFSHLSFQEYLTAKAIVERWIPNDSNDTSLLSLIRHHIFETQWLEVFPLAAVLLMRQAKPVVEYLLEESTFDTSQTIIDLEHRRENLAALHLANFVASEVPMDQKTLEKAVKQITKKQRFIERRYRIDLTTSINIFNTILNSKYGDCYRKTVRDSLFVDLETDYLYEFSNAWILIQLAENPKPDLSHITELLNSRQRPDYITGALLLMQFAFSERHLERSDFFPRSEKDALSNIFNAVLRILNMDDVLSQFVSAWCIAWSGYNEIDIIPSDLIPSFMRRLVALWLNNKLPDALKRLLSWAIYSICTPRLQIDKTPSLSAMILNRIEAPQNEFDPYAAVYLGILCKLWTRAETEERINSIKSRLSWRHPRLLNEMGYLKE